MNVIINKNVLQEVLEAFPGLTEKQIGDIFTLSRQGLGVRRIGKKLNLTKDKVHRVLKKYESECPKTQHKPSLQERKIRSLERENAALRSSAERKTMEDELEKQNLFLSLEVKGSEFVGNVIELKWMKDFTKEPHFAECRQIILDHWLSKGLDSMLDTYVIAPRYLLAARNYSDWYAAQRREIYPGTRRFATGVECLALEINERIVSETKTARARMKALRTKERKEEIKREREFKEAVTRDLIAKLKNTTLESYERELRAMGIIKVVS